ncbi:MAG: DUF2281 domain-containing protein [Saprospiraceae bacterium]|nr:DUF2281 domain-containing protein [Saprospiraceae bacterium]
MGDLTLYSKIESLPEHLKQQVADFVDFLLAKKKADEGAIKTALPFKPGFGGAKGFIVLSPDWDEPLEDFKDYM